VPFSADLDMTGSTVQAREPVPAAAIRQSCRASGTASRPPIRARSGRSSPRRVPTSSGCSPVHLWRR
jgi:hypothetical protein